MPKGPDKLFWVDMKLSPIMDYRSRPTAGVRGGKRSSLQACRDSKAQILSYDPEATVRIFEAEIVWKEVL